jgi:hypothetical protein
MCFSLPISPAINPVLLTDLETFSSESKQFGPAAGRIEGAMPEPPGHVCLEGCLAVVRQEESWTVPLRSGSRSVVFDLERFDFFRFAILVASHAAVSMVVRLKADGSNPFSGQFLTRKLRDARLFSNVTGPCL